MHADLSLTSTVSAASGKRRSAARSEATRAVARHQLSENTRVCSAEAVSERCPSARRSKHGALLPPRATQRRCRPINRPWLRQNGEVDDARAALARPRAGCLMGRHRSRRGGGRKRRLSAVSNQRSMLIRGRAKKCLPDRVDSVHGARRRLGTRGPHPQSSGEIAANAAAESSLGAPVSARPGLDTASAGAREALVELRGERAASARARRSRRSA